MPPNIFWAHALNQARFPDPKSSHPNPNHHDVQVQKLAAKVCNGLFTCRPNKLRPEALHGQLAASIQGETVSKIIRLGVLCSYKQHIGKKWGIWEAQPQAHGNDFKGGDAQRTSNRRHPWHKTDSTCSLIHFTSVVYVSPRISSGAVMKYASAASSSLPHSPKSRNDAILDYSLLASS